MTDPETKVAEPRLSRILLVLLGTFGFVAAFVWLGRWAADQPGPVAMALSVPAGALSVLLVGSIGEWFVHRYAMHTGRRFPLFRPAAKLHHRGHH